MNAAAKDIAEPIKFTEEETNMLLQGKGPMDFPDESIKRTERIGLFNWKDGLPRNIMAIIKASAANLSK